MFATDQKQIAEYAWESPEHIQDVLVFVRLTIRQHFRNVPLLMNHYRQSGNLDFHGSLSRKAYPEIVLASHEIYREQSRYREDSRSLLERILLIPGLGIVKSGFAVQLLNGQIGCLDVHNLRRFGLSKGMFCGSGSWVVVIKRIDLYLALCEQIGGAQYLWDSWCEYIAAKYPKVYTNGEAVSRLHVTTICGE